MGSILGEFLKHYLKIRVDCNYIVFRTIADYTEVGVKVDPRLLDKKRQKDAVWPVNYSNGNFELHLKRRNYNSQHNQE